MCSRRRGPPGRTQALLPSGGGGIRTRGPRERTPVFKTGAFDRSATPPRQNPRTRPRRAGGGLLAADEVAPDAGVRVRLLLVPHRAGRAVAGPAALGLAERGAGLAQ